MDIITNTHSHTECQLRTRYSHLSAQKEKTQKTDDMEIMTGIQEESLSW